MANEIITSIELDLRNAQRGLEKFKDRATDTGKKSGKRLGDGIEKSAARGIGSLTKRLLGLGAALAAAFGGRKILQLAAIQESAVQGINAALRSTGEFSKAASQDMQDFASSLQEVTAIGDEVILQGAAIAQAFTQNRELTKELTAAAIDFGAAAEISFEEAIRRLGRAMQGSVEDISKFAPEIKNLTKDQLAAGEATRILAKRFEGFAAQQAKTFQGSLQGANNAFGDFLEQIGFVVTKSPEVIGILQLIADEFKNLTQSFDVEAAQKEIRSLIKTTSDFALVIIQNVGPPLEVFVNGLVNGFKTIQLAGAELLAFFNEDFKGTADRLREEVISADIFDFSATAAAENITRKVQEVVEQVQPVTSEAGRQIASSIQDPIENTESVSISFKQIADEMSLTAEQLSKNINKSIGQGTVNAFAAFGGALASGQDALAAFGKAILGVFGDILIQLGTQTLAVGLLMEAVPILFGLQGAAAVAAGLGMIVAGGFLKGLAGAGGGGGGGATAAGGEAGGTANVETPGLGEPTEAVGQIAEDVEEGPTNTVTVNVSGNILDRRETGLELAEIIQETVGSEGTTLVRGTV